MSFNYGLEKKRFDAEWVRLRKEYAEAGMEEDAIQQMYEYDLKMFNRRRADANHEQPFAGKYCGEAEEDDESKSALYVKFAAELSCVDTYSFSTGRFAWIETIENEGLYAKLLALNDKDKELLTLLVEDEFTISEIARLQDCAIPTVWKKVARIKKILQGG